MKSVFLFAVMFVASHVSHAQTKAEKEACVQVMAAPHGGEDVVERMNKIDAALKELPKMHRDADQLRGMANTNSASRSRGEQTEKSFTDAQKTASLGEKEKRLLYCVRCQRIKADLDKIQNDVAKNCPKDIFTEYKPFIDKRRHEHEEACVKKEPYKELCKAK